MIDQVYVEWMRTLEVPPPPDQEMSEWRATSAMIVIGLDLQSAMRRAGWTVQDSVYAVLPRSIGSRAESLCQTLRDVARWKEPHGGHVLAAVGDPSFRYLEVWCWRRLTVALPPPDEGGLREFERMAGFLWVDRHYVAARPGWGWTDRITVWPPAWVTEEAMHEFERIAYALPTSRAPAVDAAEEAVA